MGPSRFSQLISRFFAVAGEVLIRHQARVDRLAGDQATGLFVLGFAGPKHREAALQAGQELLRATGHDRLDGPWVLVGIGIHTGIAFVGSVGLQTARLEQRDLELKGKSQRGVYVLKAYS